MINSPTVPRQRDVRNACHLIRANWTNTQRRERRLVAAAKRRQLIQWVRMPPSRTAPAQPRDSCEIGAARAAMR